MSRHRTTTSRSRTSKDGFTIVELLVVISIISLLLTIIIPTTISIMKLSGQLEVGAVITALGRGAERYKEDNGYFPGAGQDRRQLDNGTLTGSQLLAQSLFTDPESPSAFPQTTDYCELPANIIAEIAGKPDTLCDDTSSKKRLAICYFPADAGVGTGTNATIANQYNISHNQVYINGNGDTDEFADFITDSRSSSKPVNSGRFILLAPGVDRIYFTNDDVCNFQKN